MDLITQFELASDAGRLAMVGAAFWALAALCAVMERLRTRRRSLDRLEAVGWVPWTTVFVMSTIIGGGCLAMSLPVVLGKI
jgi:hypothetical protein